MDASQIRRNTSKLMLAFLWAHIPAVFVHSWWTGNENAVTSGLIITISALIATGVWRLVPGTLSRRAISLGLIVTAGVIVSIYEGHAWQNDVHIYFATIIALLTAFISWRLLVFTYVFIVIFYLGTFFVAPEMLFMNGGDFLELCFFLMALGVLSSGLIWLTIQVERLFENIAQEQQLVAEEAEKAQSASDEAKVAAEQARSALEEVHIAQGEAEDLRRRQKQKDEEAEDSNKAMLQALAAEFEASISEVVDKVAQMAKGMKDRAQEMQRQAQANFAKAQEIGAVVSDASDNVDSVSSATQELAGSTSEIAQQIDQTTQVTANAVSQSQEIVGHISILSERASEIGSVVDLITEIAEQTNLLALNATIEAARAGEAGRGFAVVASEVKNLATQSAGAAEGVNARVESIMQATDETLQSINRINGVITSINEGATAIAAAVEEQDAATRDIAGSVQQVSDGTHQISNHVKDVVVNAEAAGESVNAVLHAVDTLEELSTQLTVRTEAFLNKVRGE